MLIETYTEALSADFPNHVMSIAIGVCVAIAVALVIHRRKLEESVQALNIQKNEQFKVAITLSFDEIVDTKRHYSELANGEQSRDSNIYQENYPKYVFYTQVYSYALALKKHGWIKSTQGD